MKPDFLEEIYEIPGGENIKDCIQCGTCSGSCPAAPAMEHTPRQIIAMIRAGARDDVLKSNTIWMCASCYMCQHRCPSQIKITDIMYALKRVALAEGHAQPKASYMAQVFVENINTYGRNDERMLIFNYYLKTNPGKFLSYAPIGMSMISKGLLNLGAPERIKNIDQIRKIVAYVEKEGTA
jgi:heterodisulfide reductase subunit C